MVDKPVIENDTYTLWFHPTQKVVHHQLHKFMGPGKIREVLGKGVELIKRHRASKWLSDDRGNGAIPKEDSDWATQTFTPEAVRAGWKFWAIVQPEQAVGKMQMRRFIEANAKVGLTVRIFPDPDAAMAWLESC